MMNYGCDVTDKCKTSSYPPISSVSVWNNSTQTTMLLICLFACMLLLFCLPVLCIIVRLTTKVFRDADGRKKVSFAFFHPYCNAGGGGERVLWVAVRSIQKRYPNVQCVIYSGDIDVTPEQILMRARQRFNITLPGHIEFVFLYRRSWLEAVRYPYFTLLGQSLGSLLVAMEALIKFVPDVCVDTMGYAFTLPLFKYVGGSHVASYVHYPTISTDMLTRVTQRVAAHNNAAFISRSPALSRVKVIYYRMFAWLYGLAGRCSDVVMVNSTWTHNHIVQLWDVPGRTHIVYPPCDVKEFLQVPLVSDKDKPSQILSLGQFRPEKDHPLQLRSFQRFLSNVDAGDTSQYRLVLAGSCRHREDQERVEHLRKMTQELGIEKQVEFKLNVSFAELKQLLIDSMISLHTMWNEHFGICVVEGMAAGTIMLAHDSGGPKMDIVVNHCNKPTGFLAHDLESYAAAMKTIFSMSASDRLEMRENARQSISRFSAEEFETIFLLLCEPFLKKIALS